MVYIYCRRIVIEVIKLVKALILIKYPHVIMVIPKISMKYKKETYCKIDTQFSMCYILKEKLK